MSRIQEVDDDNNVTANSLAQTEQNAPDIDSVLEEWLDRGFERGGITDKSFEEVMSDISKTPLFMTNLDSTDSENDMIQAIQALQYDGTRSEIAQNFKEQGNECVVGKQWKDAKEFYSKGLAVLLVKEGKYDEPKDVEDEKAKQKQLMEQLYSNRARCHLELKNYRSTTIDCAQALRINPSNIKAYYRSASALFALDKVYEALDVCYRGLKIDQENPAMGALFKKVQERSRVKEAQDLKRRQEIKKKEREATILQTALKARSIKVGGSTEPPNMDGISIHLTPDSLSPKSTVNFPVMLLYPMHSQSDFIKAYNEKDALFEHLQYIFPLPWDESGQYRTENVDCFMDTLSGGMMKIGKKLSLLEILSGGKVEIVDSLVRIHIIPSGMTSKWIAEVKKKMAK